jgi:outer membrane protein OmpA-like peptidoglycan-associated protein
MRSQASYAVSFFLIAATVCAVPGLSQSSLTQPSQSGPAPVYKVTVIERTTKAVNYRYRSGPTKIDFRGTVLLPQARGEATVESTRGRTEIDAKFEKVVAPGRFGTGYLTYVLWALTPEGAPHNLGEVLPSAYDDAELHVTTDLQTFALIVTAEPYSAVRRPSDLVVMENEVRRGTKGTVELVDAKYELLPRGSYTWQVPSDVNSLETGRKLSRTDYEALSELYQAQNAVAIARTASADRYAPDTLAKAQQLADQARQMQDHKAHAKEVVRVAREAAQTAEDARAIAEQRQPQEQLAKAQADEARAREAQTRSEADAAQLRVQANSARAEAQADRTAAERAEADAATAQARIAQAEARARRAEEAAQTPQVIIQTVPQPSAEQRNAQQLEAKNLLRMKLLAQLNVVGSTLDTPRGLVMTIPDNDFTSASVRETSVRQLARISEIVKAQPALRVQVEGHSDSQVGEALALRRAQAVRDVLVADGLDASRASVRGLGTTRPVGSNATAVGREQNRRVEIVISGEAIGDMPLWDHTYPLSQRSGD